MARNIIGVLLLIAATSLLWPIGSLLQIVADRLQERWTRGTGDPEAEQTHMLVGLFFLIFVYGGTIVFTWLLSVAAKTRCLRSLIGVPGLLGLALSGLAVSYLALLGLTVLFSSFRV